MQINVNHTQKSPRTYAFVSMPLQLWVATMASQRHQQNSNVPPRNLVVFRYSRHHKRLLRNKTRHPLTHSTDSKNQQDRTSLTILIVSKQLDHIHHVSSSQFMQYLHNLIIGLLVRYEYKLRFDSSIAF